MHEYVSLSKAAKLVGASRVELQSKIQNGLLPTFEGQVSKQDLKEVFPEISLENDSQLERMERIQNNASHQHISMMSSERQLKQEIQRLRHQLNQTEEELRSYQRMTSELTSRLNSMQEDCSHRQKLMLKALLTWMRIQTDQKTRL